MKYLTPVLLVVISLCQSACHDEDDDMKQAPKSITFDNITLDVISNETATSAIAVENFSLLSVTTREVSGNKYYELEYSFDIRNTSSQSFNLTNPILQATLLKDSKSVGAAGVRLADIAIPPKDKHTVTYSANSGLLTNGLDIDGWTLRIVIEPYVTLDFLIHVTN